MAWILDITIFEILHDQFGITKVSFSVQVHFMDFVMTRGIVTEDETYIYHNDPVLK